MTDISTLPKPDAIVMAAKQMFLENGYEGTSMDEVASKARTTKRTIYNHFANKDVLFRTVVKHSIGLFFEKLPDLDMDGKPSDELEKFAARFCELCTWTVAIKLQRVVIAEQRRFPELAIYLAEEVMDRSAMVLADYFKALDKQTDLHFADYRQSARLFLNLATGAQRFDALFGVVEPISGPPDKKISVEIDRKPIRSAVRVFLDSIEANSTPSIAGEASGHA